MRFSLPTISEETNFLLFDKVCVSYDSVILLVKNCIKMLLVACGVT